MDHYNSDDETLISEEKLRVRSLKSDSSDSDIVKQIKNYLIQEFDQP